MQKYYYNNNYRNKKIKKYGILGIQNVEINKQIKSMVVLVGNI